MLHSLADYGAYFPWTVPISPISGAALAIIDSLRHWACKRAALQQPCKPGSPAVPRMAPRIPTCWDQSSAAGRNTAYQASQAKHTTTATRCPSNKRSRSAGEGTHAGHVAPSAHQRWHQRPAPAHQPKKVSMASITRSCTPPARAVPCGGLCRAQPLGDLDDPGRPSFRGDPIADGSFREASSLPASRTLQPHDRANFDSSSVPSIQHTGRHGLGRGVAWRGRSVGTLPCWFGSFEPHLCVLYSVTHRRASPGTPNGLDRQRAPISAKTAVQSVKKIKWPSLAKHSMVCNPRSSRNPGDFPSQFESISDLAN